MGRETLIILIGENKARKIIPAALWFSLAGLMIFYIVTALSLHNWTNGKSVLLILQAPVLVYVILLIKNSHRISLNRSFFFTLLADAQFYLAGASAWIAINVR
jgi:1,4-dihydroxy-2-naphthoate octaprenyltransferase